MLQDSAIQVYLKELLSIDLPIGFDLFHLSCEEKYNLSTDYIEHLRNKGEEIKLGNIYQFKIDRTTFTLR